MAKQQAKSPAALYAKQNQKATEVLAVTYTTTDGKQFHSESLIITKVKGGETQEKITAKRKRDWVAKENAIQHQIILNMGSSVK